MKKLIILLCMAAVLCGCSKAEPTTEATTERELPITGYHYEGAVFSVPSDWTTETKDGQFYIYPDDKSVLVITYDSRVLEEFEDDTLDRLIETAGLTGNETTSSRIATTKYGYQLAEVNGLDDLEGGTYWIYLDVILTPKGTYTFSMLNDTVYGDTDHLYMTDLSDIINTFRME